MIDAVAMAVRLSGELPPADVERLADAAAQGEFALVDLRSAAGSAALRAACMEALTVPAAGQLSGALRGAAGVRRAAGQRVDVVWGGPEPLSVASRLTSAVITEMIDGARGEMLLIGYAVHQEPLVLSALERAVGRGVGLTLLCERRVDNPNFRGTSQALPGIQARRLTWPAGVRPVGASLHAKVLVVDRRIALVGSANLTGAALGRNLECGVLVSAGPLPGEVCAHVEALESSGVLHPR